MPLLATFAPRLFISYARRDVELAKNIAAQLRQRGFYVFLDSSEIEPGENFVGRLIAELRRATAKIPIVSESYSASRWAQAELYYAAARRTVIAPLVVGPGTMDGLDEPLRRLLRDAHWTDAGTEGRSGQQTGAAHLESIAPALQLARRRQVLHLLWLAAAASVAVAALGFSVARLDAVRAAGVRRDALRQLSEAAIVLPQRRIASLASSLRGSDDASGQLEAIANDRARTDVARLNARAVAGTLREGEGERRWYVHALALENTQFVGTAFANTTFLGANWTGTSFRDASFSGVVLSGGHAFTMSSTTFQRVQFYGTVIDSIQAIDVDFVDTIFRGSTIDVTNFSKVRFERAGTPRPATQSLPRASHSSSVAQSSAMCGRPSRASSI